MILGAPREVAFAHPSVRSELRQIISDHKLHAPRQIILLPEVVTRVSTTSHGRSNQRFREVSSSNSIGIRFRSRNPATSLVRC